VSVSVPALSTVYSPVEAAAAGMLMVEDPVNEALPLILNRSLVKLGPRSNLSVPPVTLRLLPERV
jgi:hypothetical protein